MFGHKFIISIFLFSFLLNGFVYGRAINAENNDVDALEDNLFGSLMNNNNYNDDDNDDNDDTYYKERDPRYRNKLSNEEKVILSELKLNDNDSIEPIEDTNDKTNDKSADITDLDNQNNNKDGSNDDNTSKKVRTGKELWSIIMGADSPNKDTENKPNNGKLFMRKR